LDQTHIEEPDDILQNMCPHHREAPERHRAGRVRVSTAHHEKAADLLWAAAASGTAIAPLRSQFPQFGAEDAYLVQNLNTRRRIANGGKLVGSKVGLTARSVQQQLGVNQPDFGMLFADMSYGDSEPIAWHTLMQPKIEAEVALVMEHDLPEAGITIAGLLRATAFALPALEIVGSRIANWDISFVDTVADNASSSAFVLGNTPVLLDGLDLRLAGMVMERRGDQISLGAGAACLGHPLNAALWLANKMASLGNGLRAGDIVLTGALGPMATVAPGDVVEARINGLGSVRAVFGEQA
jgi:2-keto-4-pentenoate hydratase